MCTIQCISVHAANHVLSSCYGLQQRRDISNVEVGEASFVIPTHSIKTALGYDVLPIGSCLEVRASVRDVTSLRRVQGVTQTCFVSHACHINTTYLDAIVKPGLFYGSQVSCTHSVRCWWVSKDTRVEMSYLKEATCSLTFGATD